MLLRYFKFRGWLSSTILSRRAMREVCSWKRSCSYSVRFDATSFKIVFVTIKVKMDTTKLIIPEISAIVPSMHISPLSLVLDDCL